MDVRVQREGHDDQLVTVASGCTVAELKAAIHAELGLDAGCEWAYAGVGVELGEDGDEVDCMLGCVDVRPPETFIARERLRGRGAAVETQEACRQTFDDAVRRGDHECVKLLQDAELLPPRVAAEALTQWVFEYDDTRLLWALRLHDVGVDVTSWVNCEMDEFGSTPLLHACTAWQGPGASTSFEGVVAAMLECGAEVNHKRHGGFTALTLAACNGQSGVCRVLLAAGADPSVRDAEGMTPMFHAVRNISPHSVDIIRMLAKHGADPDALRSDGVSVYRHSYRELRSVLEEVGATPDAPPTPPNERDKKRRGRANGRRPDDDEAALPERGVGEVRIGFGMRLPAGPQGPKQHDRNGGGRAWAAAAPSGRPAAGAPDPTRPRGSRNMNNNNNNIFGANANPSPMPMVPPPGATAAPFSGAWPYANPAAAAAQAAAVAAAAAGNGMYDSAAAPMPPPPPPRQGGPGAFANGVPLMPSPFGYAAPPQIGGAVPFTAAANGQGAPGLVGTPLGAIPFPLPPGVVDLAAFVRTGPAAPGQVQAQAQVPVGAGGKKGSRRRGAGNNAPPPPPSHTAAGPSYPQPGMVQGIMGRTGAGYSAPPPQPQSQPQWQLNGGNPPQQGGRRGRGGADAPHAVPAVPTTGMPTMYPPQPPQPQPQPQPQQVPPTYHPLAFPGGAGAAPPPPGPPGGVGSFALPMSLLMPPSGMPFPHMMPAPAMPLPGTPQQPPPPPAGAGPAHSTAQQPPHTTRPRRGRGGGKQRTGGAGGA